MKGETDALVIAFICFLTYSLVVCVDLLVARTVGKISILEKLLNCLEGTRIKRTFSHILCIFSLLGVGVAKLIITANNKTKAVITWVINKVKVLRGADYLWLTLSLIGIGISAYEAFKDGLSLDKVIGFLIVVVLCSSLCCVLCWGNKQD